MEKIFCIFLFQILLSNGLQDWLEQPGYTEVNPGGETVLGCRVSNKKGECRWERNSLPVGAYPGKYEWAGLQEEGDCSLRILEASTEYDNGAWVCQVTASSFMERDTLMSKPANFIVREPPTSVHLRVSKSGTPILGAISAPEGSEESLDCVAKGGNPPPKLKWYLGEREMAEAQSGQNAAGDFVSTIHLSMTRGEHGKSVRCEAKHPALTKMVDVKSFLDIQYAPGVKITKSSPLRNLEEGSTVTLSCVVDSNPSSSIIWYRDGSGEIVSRTAGFELLRVEREQAGRYFCQANNTLGSSSPQFVDIDVLFAPVIDSVGPSSKVRSVYGSKMVLTCSATGNPAPTYKWIQYTSAGLVVRGEERDLVIDRLIYDDEGSYECRAANKISRQAQETRSKLIQVDVYGSPRVTEKVSEVYVTRGLTGQVSVEFCSDPLPKQTWHIDSNPGQKILISEGSSHEGYKVLNATKSAKSNCYLSTLEIAEVKDEDRAEYVVHFENEHGREIHTVRVKIGAFLGKETLIGGVIGGGLTILIVLLFLICCCAKCSRNNKAEKRDQESGSVEVWSTGSVNSDTERSEISTSTAQTQQSTATHQSTATTSSHNTSHSGLSTHSAVSASTQHSILSFNTRHSSASPRRSVASPGPCSPGSRAVSPGFTPDLIQNHCDKKNVSFTEDLSISQECMRGRVATPPVSYNDLCFPKTSNYGSMRKQGRCDILSRTNIKKIEDIIRENELAGNDMGRKNYHVNSEYQFT